MSTQSSDYIRRASSYRKEAAAALKGHWRASLGVGLILMLILMIPFAGYMYSFIDYVEQFSSSTDASSMMSAAAPISGAAMLYFLATLLVYPLVTLSLNRLSMSLVDRSLLKRPVGLHTIACGWRAYFKCIRIIFLQGWYSTWPVLLGYLVMAVVMSVGAFTSAFVQDHEAAVNLMTILGSCMIIAIFALFIIAYVRMIGYMPALYLQAVHTDNNARTLLRTSRRLMKGNKARLFRLCLSFIGWIYLAAIAAALVALVIANPLSLSLGNLSHAILLVPLCLVSLPVTLYMNTSIAAFVLGLLTGERVQAVTARMKKQETSAPDEGHAVADEAQAVLPAPADSDSSSEDELLAEMQSALSDVSEAEFLARVEASFAASDASAPSTADLVAEFQASMKNSDAPAASEEASRRPE